jgi:2,4-dienoyl-CoA reductase-like NADH-dependent reductase (Old Yellow Enzyme family)
MNSLVDIPHHRLVTHAVHKHGAKILMQILHSGRYGYHPFSFLLAIQAPINHLNHVKCQIHKFWLQLMTMHAVQAC